MSILSGAGKEAGSDAAREIHEAISEAVPQVTGALGQAEGAVKDIASGLESTVSKITDAGLAAMADAVSQIETLMYRLDGATFEIEGISVTSPVRATFRLGPYKPE